MSAVLCEFRFDIPLTSSTDPRSFERGWRTTLAAQKLTSLAMPPAQTICARFRLCGIPSEHASVLDTYLSRRLAALPGAPTVQGESPIIGSADPDAWQGVRLWLSYPAADVPKWLKRPSKSSKRTRPNHYAPGCAL